MENVPWHEEVVHFVQQLASRLDDYEIACEHAHSNCLLMAKKQFFVDGRWHTWIDYDKFQQLAADFEADPTRTFSSADYMLPTPDWAVFGSMEQGFDPTMNRFYRKGKKQPNDG